MLLRTYDTEDILAARAGVDEKTYRKYVLSVLESIARAHRKVVSEHYFILCVLKYNVAPSHTLYYYYYYKLQIVFENRHRNSNGKTCLITVDGIDFRINEPKPFSKKWYSHKFHGPGLRYEIGVCIQTGDIVWVNGPFKPGVKNDLNFFRSGLRGMLNPGEKVEADSGYRGELATIRHPGVFVSRSDKRAKGRARARHETVNGRLCNFKVLKATYRHSLKKHKTFFLSVAVITQLSFDCGERPFQLNY